jgi:hypothetical protein
LHKIASHEKKSLENHWNRFSIEIDDLVATVEALMIIQIPPSQCWNLQLGMFCEPMKNLSGILVRRKHWIEDFHNAPVVDDQGHPCHLRRGSFQLPEQAFFIPGVKW